MQLSNANETKNVSEVKKWTIITTETRCLTTFRISIFRKFGGKINTDRPGKRE